MQENHTAEECVTKKEQKAKLVRRNLPIKRIINYHVKRSPSTVTAVSGVFMFSIAKQVFRQTIQHQKATHR